MTVRDQTAEIDRRLLTAGLLFVVANAALITIRSITDMAMYGILSTLLITIFSFYHGVKRYGAKAMVFFVGMILVISWSYETLSVLTGFPFGNYHYTELLPPKIWLVPTIIMPAYFAMGYLSWTIASVLLGKRDSAISKGELLLMPVIASFVMVMWDMTMDPFNSTISEFWIWHDGGAYFGVPFVNFLGWYLCVFTFYFVFALYLRKTKLQTGATTVSIRAFWTLPILMYLSRTIEYFGNMLYENQQITDQAGHVWHTADINGSLALVSIFTMIFVSFLGLVLLRRTNDLSTSGR